MESTDRFDLTVEVNDNAALPANRLTYTYTVVLMLIDVNEVYNSQTHFGITSIVLHSLQHAA